MSDVTRDESGVAYVEYIAIVILVGIVVAGAIVAVGLPMLSSYRGTQVFLGAPVP